MRKVLMIVAIIASLVSQAQTGTYDFLNTRKRLTVKSWYITDFKNDTANWNASGSRYLPTAKAVYDFVTGRTAALGGGTMDTSMLSLSYTRVQRFIDSITLMMRKADSFSVSKPLGYLTQYSPQFTGDKTIYGGLRVNYNSDTAWSIIRSKDNPWMFFVNGNTNKIGINNGFPATTMHIKNSDDSNAPLLVENSPSNTGVQLQVAGSMPGIAFNNISGLRVLAKIPGTSDLAIFDAAAHGAGTDWHKLWGDGSYSNLGSISVGSHTFDASAQLSVNSTTKGVLLPKLTTTQRNAIASPTTGLIIYNTTDSVFQFYRLSGWTNVGSVGGSMVYPGAGIAVSTGSAWGTSITDNSTNWNTAYTDRMKWDGGSTGLTASTGRTSLGATTVGSNLFTVTNPSAIRFIRINADNSVTLLDAASQLSTLSGVSTARSISTTSPLAGGGDLSADRTLSIANAAADGATKGAASFGANDFNASSGNITLDYTNGQKATNAQPGFMTAAQVARLDSNQYIKPGEGIDTTWSVDTLNIKLKYDTCAVASFGAGSMAAGDTAAFSTTAIYGSFYNSGSDTLIITRMQIGLQGTSPNITLDVYWNDSLNVSAGATKLVTAGSAATNIYTGTAVTSFNNTKIPPGNWIWLKSSTVATKPTYLTMTLIGYKKRVTP